MGVEAIMDNVAGGQSDSFRGGNRRDVLLQRPLHQNPDAGSSHFSCMTCVYGVKSIALLKRESGCCMTLVGGDFIWAVVSGV